MTLFHYTTIETLYAIIKGINNDDENAIRFTLRATHAGFLNDLTEGQLLGNALRKLGVSEGLLDILNSIQGYPFVVSLSELEDDLNMWRCYSNQGKGIAIGLDKDVIVDTMKHQLWGAVADFNQCKYCTEDELVDYLKSNNFKSALDNKNDDILPLSRLMARALEYKNKSFEAEKEWRIYVNFNETDFRVSDDLVIPYYNILLPIEAIVSITFGPKCNYLKNCFSTYRLIKSKIGQRVERIELKQSQVPLV